MDRVDLDIRWFQLATQWPLILRRARLSATSYAILWDLIAETYAVRSPEPGAGTEKREWRGRATAIRTPAQIADAIGLDRGGVARTLKLLTAQKVTVSGSHGVGLNPDWKAWDLWSPEDLQAIDACQLSIVNRQQSAVKRQQPTVKRQQTIDKRQQSSYARATELGELGEKGEDPPTPKSNGHPGSEPDWWSV